MFIDNYIFRNKEKFERICTAHQVRSLYAFGSSTNKHFDQTSSDIDLFVEIDEQDPLKKGEMLISFWDKLESFFGRKVDLLTPQSLQNPYLKSNIEDTKLLIYDGSKQKISA